jgi:hypothetical protein
MTTWPIGRPKYLVLILSVVTLLTLPLLIPDHSDAYIPRSKQSCLWRHVKLKCSSATASTISFIELAFARHSACDLVPGTHTWLRPRYTYTRCMILAATAIMAMPSVNHRIHATKECEPFDTDSSTVGIDNRCSGCISHINEDFVGELKKTDRVIKGFGGATFCLSPGYTNFHTTK